MAESPFLALAEREDLDYAESVSPVAQGKFPLPRGEASELVGGTLPGGYEGIAARLHRKVGESDETIELTLVATRIPESLDFARYITCFEAGFRGIVSRAIGAGGLGWIREFDFESIEFNRRYRVAMLRTGKELRLRQLFSPTFLDWMADIAPEGLYWDLVSGVLTVTFAGGSVNGPDDVQRACELAGHIAERIRSEALEGPGLGDAEGADAETIRAGFEQRYAEQMERADFDGAPTDVATALDRLGPAIKGKRGLLGRIFGSSKSPEATMVSLTAVLRTYGERAGLEHHYPDAITELFPFFDHFPLPVMRLLSLRGTLPATTASGDLAALLDLKKLGSADGRAWPAFRVENETAGDAFVHVLPRAGGPEPSAIGSFSVALGDGARRETESTREAREEAEGLADSLDGRFNVTIDPRAPRPGKAARAWLASSAAGALVLEAGALTLVGAPRPAIEWSVDTLGEFSEAVAPVVDEPLTQSTRR